MADSRHRREIRFHETPLVLFSVLGVAGAGLGSAHLLTMAIGKGPMALSFGEGSLLSALLLLGMALSTGHLGKPLRGPLALRGVGRSPLSGEILALGLAVSMGALGVIAELFILEPSSLRPFLGLLTSLSSLAFLLALGILYNLPGQPGWQGPALVQPLLLGTAWGLLMGPWVSQDPSPGGTRILLLVILAADAVVALLRGWRSKTVLAVGFPLYPRLFSRGRGLLALRTVLGAVLTPLTVGLGFLWVATLLFSLTLILDRVAFYSLAVRTTTESEVARVEALL
jgi:DMSO reductase anchor subunit